jgi:hypothetical protein
MGSVEDGEWPTGSKEALSEGKEDLEFKASECKCSVPCDKAVTIAAMKEE